MTRPAVTGTAILLLLFGSPLFAHESAVKHVQINPISADRFDLLVGAGEFIRIEFINESDNRNVKVFPEPPITVRDSRTSTRCTIDGGVWVRDSVFLCHDEKVLIVQEFSGSNDFLNFHDTSSCAKLRSINITNANWNLAGPELVIKKQSVQRFLLMHLCDPGEQ